MRTEREEVKWTGGLYYVHASSTGRKSILYTLLMFSIALLPHNTSACTCRINENRWGDVDAARMGWRKLHKF